MSNPPNPPTAPIVPRWEWRTFAPGLDAVAEHLRTLDPSALIESDEVYFVSDGCENVKIRDGKMDIKVLTATNFDGLEQWAPVLKAEFPLSKEEVGTVLESLRLDLPALARDEYTLEQLLDELIRPTGMVREVRVHKSRIHCTVGGCIGEVADITANEHTGRTMAVEFPDADAVMAAVREVGLGDYVNTNYPKGLASLIDDSSLRYAVIDVGTNSVKFHVADAVADGVWRKVVDRAEVSRLGEGIEETNTIASAALNRTVDAIAGMVGEARELGALAIAGVGTAGLRIARNGEEATAEIRKRTGVEVQVISGEEESRLAYLAALAGLGTPDGQVVVFDTGGGSSQFTFGHGSTVDERFSVNVGAVSCTERFGLAEAVSQETLREALSAIASGLSRLDGRPAPDALVGMGGALTNIAAVKHSLAIYDPDVVQGTVLDCAEIDRQIELYRSRDASARRDIVGLQPKRADVILAGACIVRTIMDKLNQSSLTVSDRGLRHGMLIERFGGASRRV